MKVTGVFSGRFAAVSCRTLIQPACHACGVFQHLSEQQPPMVHVASPYLVKGQRQQAAWMGVDRGEQGALKAGWHRQPRQLLYPAQPHSTQLTPLTRQLL